VHGIAEAVITGHLDYVVDASRPRAVPIPWRLVRDRGSGADWRRSSRRGSGVDGSTETA
jgi:hypothetical protein